jgi:hypothetical protein
VAEGLRGFELYDASNIREDLRSLMDMIGPVETPFLSRIGFDGPPAENQKVEWTEKEHHALSTLANEAVDNSETAIDVTAGTGTEFYEGSIVLIDSEKMIVTASAADVLTVVRAQCNTSAATHDDGSTITLIGHTSFDNTDLPVTKHKTATRVYNWVQPIMLPVQLTEIAKAVNNISAPDLMGHEKSIVLKQAMRSLELSVLRGSAQAASQQGSNTVMQTMKGIQEMISTNNTAAADAELTEANLINAIESAWDNAGNVGLAVMNSYQNRIISGWKTDRVRFAQGERRIGGVVDQYESEFGVIDIMLNRYMPTDEIFLVDTSKIQMRPMIPFVFFEVARTGTAEKGFVYGVYTVELVNEKQHAKITGLAID